MDQLILLYNAINHEDKITSKNEDRAIDAGKLLQISHNFLSILFSILIIDMHLGGPTRQFFSSVWTNLESLCLSYGSTNSPIKIKLFKTEKAGLVPTSNDFIQNQIKLIVRRSRKSYDYESILNRVKKYYKVVGIILFRAIICGIPIASHVLPSLYRNGKAKLSKFVQTLEKNCLVGPPRCMSIMSMEKSIERKLWEI